jgi:hypothetical protein
MTKQDFLRMMVEDNETNSNAAQKSLYADVIDCIDIALSQSPDSVDVAPDKTIKGAFELIKAAAKAKPPVDGAAAVGPFEAAELIAGYLGVAYTRASKRYATARPVAAVNLDDFI